MLTKKTLLSVFLGTCFLLELQPANATTSTRPVIPLHEPSITKPDPLNDLLLQQFLSLTPKKYHELTGKKMSFPQKISLNLAQHKVKRMIKKGKPVDLVAIRKNLETSDFNITGFLLGIILNLIGVVIAYLVGGENIIKWAWIGAGIQSILLLLILILVV